MNRTKTNTMLYATALATLVIATTPLWSTESDLGIEQALQETHVFQTALKDEAIYVATTDGVVTLRGTVSDETSRILAQDTAESLPGVVRVDNLLRTVAEKDADREDVWIRRKVKLSLQYHRKVRLGDNPVFVTNGVVTIGGVAKSIAQKELTGKYAGDIKGVVAVVNQMTVSDKAEAEERTQAEKHDDASITALVKAVLMNHRATSEVRTKVVTRNGKVMLTGIARNETEKILVTELASDVLGVDSVLNQMTILEQVTD